MRKVGFFHAARAHTRHDLRDAIVHACRSRTRRGHQPATDVLRRELLGRRSPRLFSRVAREYLLGIEPASHAIGRAGRSMVASGCRFTEAVRLSRFQRWRRSAWNEAKTNLGEQPR